MTIRIVPVVPTPSQSAEPDWQNQALCAGKTDLFFEPLGEREGRRTKREAKARSYCALCPLAVACREAGRINREHGIWGGETDEQRALAGYPPRNIARRGVALARRQGMTSETMAPLETIGYQIHAEPLTPPISDMTLERSSVST